jgi:hypothetical protein
LTTIRQPAVTVEFRAERVVGQVDPSDPEAWRPMPTTKTMLLARSGG